MKVGDLVMLGEHIWRIEGIYLGCLGQESLVELRNLRDKPGVPGVTGWKETSFVPLPLVRDHVYARVVQE